MSGNTTVIGYFAYASVSEVVCDGDACVIAGSDADLVRYLAELGQSGNINHITIRKARFQDILQGMKFGGAYALDEVAYNRFYPIAARNGFNLGQEEFPPTETGMHFVRVKIV